MKRGPPSADERDPKRQNTTPTLTVEREYKEVRTNYWPLELYTNKTIFKYHYEFADGKIITEQEQLRRIFRLAFDAMQMPPKTRRFVWGNSLFTLEPLPQKFLKTPVELSEKVKDEETPKVLCSIIISGPDAFDFESNVQGMQRAYRKAEGQEYEMVWRKEGAFICQIINILLKPILIKEMGLTPMGRRGYFNVSASEGNDRNVSFMPGFNPVVVLQNNRLFLHTDFQYRAISRENSTRFIRNSDPNKIPGQSVYCEHNRRHYIISGVRHDMSPFSTFTLKDGTVTTYADYYQKRYGLRVRDNGQPLLEVTQRRKQGTDLIYLVPEFCKVAGIPKEELKNTRLPTTSTSERYQKLSKFIAEFATGVSKSHFTTVKTSTNCFDPQAKLLRPQDIKFHAQNFRLTNTNVWDQLLRNNSGNKMLNVPLFNWEIWVTQRDLENDARNYYDTFMQLMRPLCPNGINQPTWVHDSATNIRQAVSKTKPAVVLVVLQSATPEPYNQIKRDLLLAGVPGQIVVKEKFLKGNRPDMSKVTKAGLQLLTKAGAVLWSTSFAANDPLSNKLAALHTCVFGIERSIGRKSGDTTKMAVTCTVDRDPTSFSEYFNYHVGENANSMPSLQSVIERGLQAFKQKNNKLPGRLLLYSSGASEGALKLVLANDVKEVQSAIAEFYKGLPQPEVLYMLVCRSGTTRLFVEEKGAAFNVKPGTVVDRNICDNNTEFYLVSHDGGQKSVLPPKYILAHHEVAEDKKQVSLTMKDLQRLSFGLCHLYYNWPGPISCPAPLKYADKLAKLAAAAGLPSRPDNALATKLFYI
jgi:hypothetical protein